MLLISRISSTRRNIFFLCTTACLQCSIYALALLALLLLLLLLWSTPSPPHTAISCVDTQTACALPGCGEGTRSSAELISAPHRPRRREQLATGSAFAINHWEISARPEGEAPEQGSLSPCGDAMQKLGSNRDFSVRGLRTKGCSVATSTTYADDGRGEEKCNRSALFCEFH